MLVCHVIRGGVNINDLGLRNVLISSELFVVLLLVSGVLITANLTGLKAGSQYNVKCVAAGKGGTVTTSVTKVMTLC